VLTDRELTEAIGTTAYDAGGDEVGTVEHFFVDDRTGAPTWVAVKSGLFGARHAIVPALDATYADGALRLPVSREAVRSAPPLRVDQHLDPGDEDDLRRHYALADAAAPVAAPAPETPAPAPVQDTPAPSDGAMTRSEEQLRVYTERTAATRVRVTRYVVTEEVQITVPVRREEIRVEEVPLDAPDTGPGESLVPQERTDQGLPEEIVLHREEPVVSVRVVPAERVRLRTEAVAGQERVSAQVQRERIVVEDPSPSA
jgi:stress response protein YsnF